MMTVVFWNVIWCSLVDECRRFTGTCHQAARRHIPEAAGFVVTAEIASNKTSDETDFIA
jgi:hypothetical protein